MIQSRKELKNCLALESELYYGDKKIKHILAHTKNHSIFKFVSALRHEEYYKNTCRFVLGKILYCYYKRKKNCIGQKLGLDIPANCFGKGLRIYHVGGGSY